eukprot:18385-Heterococcus_DN1.PRE.3
MVLPSARPNCLLLLLANEHKLSCAALQEGCRLWQCEYLRVMISQLHNRQLATYLCDHDRRATSSISEQRLMTNTLAAVSGCESPKNTGLEQI